MGQLAHPVPVGSLIVDRGWETVLGAVVAMVVLVIVREPTVTAGEPGQEMLRP